MKNVIAMAMGLCLGAGASMAEIIKVPAAGNVSETMDRLEQAVGKAGATVFARVDHAAGAKKIGETIPPEQLLIFGNPKLGTPAMVDDPLSGLLLPLRVLVYEDAQGKVWLAYEDPKTMLGDLMVPDDAPYVPKMRGALSKLTEAAAGD